MSAGYIRWTHVEWLGVAVNMLPRLEKGETNLVALANAMRKVVDKKRWQSDDFIAHTCQPKRALGLLKSWLDKARALPEAERNAMLVLTPAQRFALENPDAPKPERKPQPKRGKLDEGREYTGNVRWTTGEKAKIVRMVDYFKDHGVTSSLGRMIVEAQELVIAKDRRRSVAGIMQGNHGGGNQRLYDEGKNNLWLLKDVPFDPPKPPSAGSSVAEQAQESQETAQIGPIATAPVQTQPEPSPAPLPRGTIREDMSAAAQAFGNTVMQALDTLLGHHTQLVLSSIEARLNASAASHAVEVAAMVESGMRKAVANMLAHELGGPVVPPAAPAPAASAVVPGPPAHHNPAPTSKARPEQLKVDVVGFEQGSQEQLVASAFAGEVDLRFIHPDKMSSFSPHGNRHVVMLTGRVSHGLRDKFRAAKVEPVYVNKTPGHVIHAIEELQRSRVSAH